MHTTLMKGSFETKLITAIEAVNYAATRVIFANNMIEFCRDYFQARYTITDAVAKVTPTFVTLFLGPNSGADNPHTETVPKETEVCFRNANHKEGIVHDKSFEWGGATAPD
jgi:hypothetical protein